MCAKLAADIVKMTELQDESMASSSEDAAAAAVGATAAGWYQIHFIEQNTTGIVFDQFHCTSTFFRFTMWDGDEASSEPNAWPILTKGLLKSVKSFYQTLRVFL